MQDACNTQADCLSGFTCQQNLCVVPGAGGAGGGLGASGGGPNANNANDTSSGNGGEPSVSASNFVVGCAAASIKAGGPAAGLAFIAQPSQGMVNTPLCPVQVGFVDANGNLDTNGGMHVTLSLIASPNATNAALTGVLSMDANHGIATFSQLVINTPATGYVLQVTASNGWTAKSTPFAVQVPAWTPLATPAGNNVSLSGDANGDVFMMNSVGLYASRDGGSLWPLADANAPFGSVMVDPLNGNNLYVEADGCLFRSSDGGAAFALTCGESTSCTTNGSGVTVQAVDDAAHVLYGSNNSGVFSSADNGNSWDLILELDGSATPAVTLGGSNPGVLYVASGGTINFSTADFPAHTSWSQTEVFGENMLTVITADPRDANVAYVGGVNGLYVMRITGQTAAAEQKLYTCASRIDAAALDGNSTGVFAVMNDCYTGTQGVYASPTVVTSLDGGNSWGMAAWGLAPKGPLNGLGQGCGVTLVSDPAAPGTLYVSLGACGGVYKTTNGGL